MEKLFRYILPVLIFSFGASISCSNQNETYTPEDLGEKILESFKTNDYGMFESCFVTKKNIEYFLKNSNKKISTDERKIVWEHLQELHTDLNSIFKDIREKGNESGINWANVTYIKVDYETQQEDSLITADYIDVLFKDNDLHFTMRLDDCVKFSNSWKIMDRPYLKKISL